MAIPKLRQGSYFPDWLLDRQQRAEAALISVAATYYPGATSPSPSPELRAILTHMAS